MLTLMQIVNGVIIRPDLGEIVRANDKVTQLEWHTDVSD